MNKPSVGFKIAVCAIFIVLAAIPELFIPNPVPDIRHRIKLAAMVVFSCFMFLRSCKNFERENSP